MSKRRLTKDHVFMLKGWTVKTEKGLYYVAPSIALGNKLEWSKPYRSLQHATTAIARKLQREFTRREGRLS